jgi:hypothetical protein
MEHVRYHLIFILNFARARSLPVHLLPGIYNYQNDTWTNHQLVQAYHLITPISNSMDKNPIFPKCRSVDCFEKVPSIYPLIHQLGRIQEGSYGVVYKAKDKETGQIVALKRIKMDNNQEGFPISSLREINILMKLQHDNIVTVKEIVIGGKNDRYDQY